MATNTDFIVKNGLQVTSNIVIGSYVTNIAPVTSGVTNGIISSGNVVIGSNSVPIGSRLMVVGGNINLNSNSGVQSGFGVVYSDGTFQTTASSSVSASISKYSTTIGDGTSNVYSVMHNLNDANVSIIVKEVSSNYIVYPDIQQTNVNAISVQFVAAPTINQYSVLVIAV